MAQAKAAAVKLPPKRRGRPAGAVGAVHGIGGNALAKETGFAQAYVSRMLKKGHSPESIRQRAISRQQKTGGVVVPNAAATAVHRSTFQHSSQVGKLGPGRVSRKIGNEDLASATLRKEIAMADAREMANAIQAGSLVSRAQMADWFAAGIVGAKDDLLKLEELGDAFAQELDPAVIRMTIRREVESALARLENAYRLSAEQAMEPDDAVDGKTEREDDE